MHCITLEISLMKGMAHISCNVLILDQIYRCTFSGKDMIAAILWRARLLHNVSDRRDMDEFVLD